MIGVVLWRGRAAYPQGFVQLFKFNLGLLEHVAGTRPDGVPRTTAQHFRRGDRGGAHGPYLLRLRPLQRGCDPPRGVDLRPVRLPAGHLRRAHFLRLLRLRPQQRRLHQPRGDVPPTQVRSVSVLALALDGVVGWSIK